MNSKSVKPSVIVGVLIISLCLANLSLAAEPTAEEIIKSVDTALRAGGNNTASAEMTITTTTGEKRTFDLDLYVKLDETVKTLIRFLGPPKVKGVGYLILGDTLKVFYPTTGRIQALPSSIIRKGLQGSDFTLEDIIRSKPFSGNYTPKILGTEKLEGKDVYVLELTAAGKDLAYSKLKMWVDAESLTPAKQEYYDLDGKLLKTLYYKDIKDMEGFWSPMLLVVENEQTGHKSTVVIKKYDFTTVIPDDTFTERKLRDWK